ncbi:amidohydrolase family protein [Schlesneria paludicola]|uniref:amidohydrolase family protein n=1 Tax=Schlesneria paludicola TaxID=360056 RepID=UPI00029B2078|nr:amidohydrolase family protein [Schlesneria paludicola]
MTQMAPESSPIRSIDCQSHLYCPEILDRLECRSDDPLVYRRDGDRYVKMGGWHRKVFPHHMDVAVKLANMDANGIAMTALSINDPGPEWFGSDGVAVARVMNDFIADIVRQHPHRFLGLCVLPLQDVTASLIELDRAVGELAMKGILLYTNLAGRFPDEPAFWPIFAKAEELDIPILLHPAKPVTTELVKDYEMTSSLGNMFEDTIALTRIIMSGLLDRHPRLKLVCPHLGGTLPYMIGRIDHQTQVLKRGPKYLTRKPSEYLKQVWFDIVSPAPLAMKYCLEMLGPDKLLFASDHPWVEPDVIRDALSSLQLPHEIEAKILSGNARRLFGLE